MTRAGGGIKILRGAPKMFRHLTGGGLKKFVGGGGENLYSLKPTGGWGGGAP